ncbi:peptidoglycan DD-metalloendopeptidase family protein [Pseudahrensia aquimaris]|uniref:Peptidoglycan DD-metalloendopeptidase family protein n=1 Tax=Pseudahrensia aquimaris TaxID=744461 RepID=A0ABW3FIH0_9HYPH
MRSKLYTRRLRALSQASALLVLAGFTAACSSDAMRFDDVMTTGTSLTPNQHQILHKGKSDQPFPEAAAPSPSAPSTTGIRVVQPTVSASPLPSVSAPSAATQSPASSAARTYTPPAASNVLSASKPTPSLAQQAGAPIVLAPRRNGPVELAVTGADSLPTGSVSQVAKTVTQTKAATKGGWSGAGGTYVTARSGETLYNLSRRYGVPVEAIMRANNMGNADALQAGSKILIPAYTYSANSRVSAPDNHPVTKAVRASTGFQGQAQGSVATPKQRIKSAKTTISEPVVSAPEVGASGRHTIVSGDTLYGVARKYTVSPGSLRAANNMSGSTLRLGQTLVIPQGGATPPPTITKATAPKPATEPTPQVIDEGTTGSIPATTRQQPVESAKKLKPVYSAPTIAQKSAEEVSTPKKTSAGSFRWPTRGRVLTKFGERQNGTINDGIDISVPEGTPIKAAEAGTVIYSGSELADFGNLILVSHSGGWVSAYAHASKNKVRRGDKVGRGQVIAMSGKTGNAEVPKLHFELRKDSTPVNPLKHLSK